MNPSHTIADDRLAPFTTVETRTLCLLYEGRTMADIAAQDGVSRAALSRRLQRIREKSPHLGQWAGIAGEVNRRRTLEVGEERRAAVSAELFRLVVWEPLEAKLAEIEAFRRLCRSLMSQNGHANLTRARMFR